MKKLVSYTLLFFILGFVYPSHAQVQYNSCTASGANASAIGNKTTASGNNSLAGGYTTQATGSNSFAFGYNSKATQSTTAAIGNTAIASGVGSMAMGNYVKATAQNAFVFGSGTTASYPLTNNTANSIAFGVNSNKPTLLITKSLNNNYTGKVAIGSITAPQAKLHIVSDNNEDAGVMIETSDKNGHKAFITLFDDTHRITVDHSAMELDAGTGALRLQGDNITLNDKIGINTVKDYALAVDGGIISTKVYIKEVKQWPDYVFAEDYSLMGLEELKLYLAENRHLPGLPSEQEILNNGYDLNDMQCALLQKIEELTQYVILLQDEIKELKTAPLGDSIVFSYDSNGNRISRSLVFERIINSESPIATASPSAFTLFPNPTYGEFSLQLNHPRGNITTRATLLNVSGTILETKELEGDGITFDLSRQPEGIYLLEVDGPMGHEAWKVIKK